MRYIELGDKNQEPLKRDATAVGTMGERRPNEAFAQDDEK